MAHFTGGCLCGKIRFTASADPIFTGICHCRNCQKQSGTAFSVVIGVPASAVSVQGEMKTYHDTGDSGQEVERRFCPDCGSPITTEVAVMPDVIIIKAGTLDDPSGLQPAMEIYCDSAQPWVQLGGERTRFPKMPG
jgi:hypothetical protein